MEDGVVGAGVEPEQALAMAARDAREAGGVERRLERHALEAVDELVWVDDAVVVEVELGAPVRSRTSTSQTCAARSGRGSPGRAHSSSHLTIASRDMALVGFSKSSIVS